MMNYMNSLLYCPTPTLCNIFGLFQSSIPKEDECTISNELQKPKDGADAVNFAAGSGSTAKVRAPPAKLFKLGSQKPKHQRSEADPFYEF